MRKQTEQRIRWGLIGSQISLIALAAGGAVSPAGAEESYTITSNWLDTIVVSGARTEETIRETPHTISVIDRKEIEDSSFVDSRNELLRRIPGNSMIRNLRIPIGGKNYTINLVDGLAVRGIGRGTFSFIDESNTMDIERVEVTRGPASSLYGSNAIGGVINVITRKPPKETEMRGWSDTGSWGRRRFGLQGAGSTGPVGIFLDANMEKKDGWQENSGFDRKRASGKVIYEYGQASSVTVRGEYLDLNDHDPGTLTKAKYDADWRQAGVSDAFTHQKLSSFSTIAEHHFSDKTLFRIAYGTRYSDEVGTPSYSATGAYGHAIAHTHNVVPQLEQQFDFLKTRVVVGTDLIHDDEVSKTMKTRSMTSPVDQDLDVLSKQKSPFSQIEFWPTDWMKVSLGGRYDSVDMTVDGYKKLTTTPTAITGERTFESFSKNAGVTFNLDRNNSLWLSYGEGFVIPSTTSLFTSSRASGRGYNSDPNLDPEQATNYGVGLRGLLFDNTFGYDVSLYDTTIRDLVITNDESYMYENAGRATFRGVEASLTYQPLDWLGFGAAYTYAQNILADYNTGAGVDLSGNTLQASPLHHLNARLILTPVQLPGSKVELEWDRISEYHTSDTNADPLGLYQRPDLLHLRTSYETDTYRLWGNIRNLTNVKHPDRVTYSSSSGRSYTSGEPLTFVVGAALKW